MITYEKLLQGARNRRSRRQFPYYRPCWRGGFRRRRAVSQRRGAERLPDGCRHREADGVPIPKTRLGARRSMAAPPATPDTPFPNASVNASKKPSAGPRLWLACAKCTIAACQKSVGNSLSRWLPITSSACRNCSRRPGHDIHFSRGDNAGVRVVARQMPGVGEPRSHHWW